MVVLNRRLQQCGVNPLSKVTNSSNEATTSLSQNSNSIASVESEELYTEFVALRNIVIGEESEPGPSIYGVPGPGERD